MPIPYHGQLNYNVTEETTGVDDTGIIAKINAYIDSININGSEIDPDKWYGESTIANGGVLGNLLRLLRVHINDMKDKQELSSDIAGQVYSSMIQTAISTSMQFLTADFELKQKSKLNDSSILNALIQGEQLLIDAKIKEWQRRETEFDLKVLKPLEREKLIEEVETLHIKHQVDQYNLDTILPDEHDKLIANRELIESQKDKVDYEVNTLMPDEHIINPHKVSLVDSETALNNARAAKVNRDKDLVDKQICITQAECDIKNYYRLHIQPHEADLAELKAILESITAGGSGSGTSYSKNDSLPYVRIQQTKKQTELYDRQKDAYDDNKYQKLFETQMNFAGIIFADAETQEPLTAVAGATPVTHTYDALKPPQ